jgi:hypothetical protein
MFQGRTPIPCNKAFLSFKGLIFAIAPPTLCVDGKGIVKVMELLEVSELNNATKVSRYHFHLAPTSPLITLSTSAWKEEF